jgi:hypothetical protein
MICGLKLRRMAWRCALAVLAIASATLVKPALAAEPIGGLVGVGTWATQAEFKDIVVTRNGQKLFASDFSKGLRGWKTVRGKWEVVDGILRQTSHDEDARALVGDPTWSNYTLSLRARKLSGNEGFLVFFGMPAPDANSMSMWNIGGWGNTACGIQAPGIVDKHVPGTIEVGRWYDIKIELNGNTVRAYLDGKPVVSATQTPAQRDLGHALIPDLLADPSFAEFDGTFYCYGTTDGAGGGLGTAGLPVVWKSKDFLNWSFSGSIFPSNFDAKYWAPSAPVYKNGRYYLFPTLDNRIMASVGDSPEGPFRTLDGKDINRATGWQPFPLMAGNTIDADILHDDDGAYYMVWSMHHIAKLKPDFSSFDGAPTPIPTKRGGYSEGPCIFKRNGIYYYLYTLGANESYRYAYMMSRVSPLGPWEGPERDLIAVTDRKIGYYGPGHGGVFHPKGSPQWYFVCLEYGRSGTTRQVFAHKMNFNADGTIQPIELSLQGVGAIRPNAEYATPNLAMGKHATASSTRPDFQVPRIDDPRLNRIEGYSPANALDGSNGSRWMAREGDAQAWYQLDLGQAQDIKRTELYFVKPTAGHAYRLDYSVDGNTWHRYGGHEQVTVQSPHTDVKSVSARYLKLTILRGTPGLWEFRVY